MRKLIIGTRLQKSFDQAEIQVIKQDKENVYFFRRHRHNAGLRHNLMWKHQNSVKLRMTR